MRKPILLGLIASTIAFSVHAQPQKPPPPQKPPTTAMPTQGPLGPAIDAIKNGDYAAAEKALSTIKTNDALLMLAQVYFDQGKYAEAEKIVVPLKADGIPLRAKMLFQTGKTQDAVKLLDGAKNEKGRAGQKIRLQLGEYLIATGHRDDADAPLMTLIDDVNNNVIKDSDAEGNALAGRAAYLLRAYKNAVTLFLNAFGVEQNQYLGRMWASEEYLEKYDPGAAEDNLNKAAKNAPKNPEVLVQLARIRVEQTMDFDEIEKLANEAIKINPKMASAYAIKAGLALRDNDVQVADKHIADGLAINPNDLELLSLKAASKFLADDMPGYEQAKKDVLAKNGEYSHMYSIIAEYAEWEHRYDDIVTMMKEAVKIDPKDAKAIAQLGLMQLRAGDEDEGVKNLDSAFRKDSYNVRVFNTLNLYEKNIATDYDLVTDGPFKIRYPKATEAVLKRYVPRLMSQAWASMKTRYGFVPQTPVQVELYEDAATKQKGFIPQARAQFAVRTSGLPNIGIQGVCFGKVLAAMGPHSEPFNWGNVLWHELGHVFAIQLSKAHVPRWFTEALSEYETFSQRPEWRRTLDPQLYKAIQNGKLPGAVDMNRAFTHADDPNDILTAYYASSQMMVFTVETFGFPKVVEALKLWGKGIRTPEVIKQAFGVTDKEYDQKFRAWEMKRLERYKGQFSFDLKPKSVEEAKDLVKQKPNDANAHVDLAYAYFHSRDRDNTMKEIDQALKLDPKNQNAHYIYAQISLVDKDRESAEKHIQAIRDSGGDGYKIQMILGDLATLRKDSAAATKAYEQAWRFDATQPEPLENIAKIAKDEKRIPDMVEALRKLAPLSQHDQGVWSILLDTLVDQKQWAEAVKVGESAVLLNVGSAEVHVDYALALEAQGDQERAIYESESALVCTGLQPKVAAEAHVVLARVALAKKNTQDARKHRDEALKLDPESTEAKAIQIP